MYLNLNGIPTAQPPEGNTTYFSFDPQGAWLPSSGNLLHDVDNTCVKIHVLLAANIFGSHEKYHSYLPVIPEFLHRAGLNSESSLSKLEFEQAIRESDGLPMLYESLYLYDCQSLVYNIQECSKEVIYLQGEFYRALNLDQLFYPEVEEPDGLRYITSPIVSNIFAVLSFIFIRLHSLLDYTTKLVHEVEHMKSKFTSYQKLSSKNVLYSGRKKLSLNKTPKSLFEVCDLISEIEVYRNLIIHNGLLDNHPKIYKLNVNQVTTEKFILAPDRGPEGRLDAHKNRSLFYSRDDKINLRLSSLVADFNERLHFTLEQTINILDAKA